MLAGCIGGSIDYYSRILSRVRSFGHRKSETKAQSVVQAQLYINIQMAFIMLVPWPNGKALLSGSYCLDKTELLDVAKIVGSSPIGIEAIYFCSLCTHVCVYT